MAHVSLGTAAMIARLLRILDSFPVGQKISAYLLKGLLLGVQKGQSYGRIEVYRDVLFGIKYLLLNKLLCVFQPLLRLP